MNNDELLPVGSIVNIRFSKEKYMIMGFHTKDANTNEIYDYSAVIYPYGLINLNEVTMFNKDLIKKIIYRGLDSEEDKLFKEKLKEIVENKDVNTKSKEKDVNQKTNNKDFTVIDL